MYDCPVAAAHSFGMREPLVRQFFGLASADATGFCGAEAHPVISASRQVAVSSDLNISITLSCGRLAVYAAATPALSVG